ncbi:MAG: hypothetical protein KBD21_04770 [Candidatus Pacebacteria bacterium]|nr:hypothetical protein [Candidatus Paceibacterota bacterium]
MVASVAMLWYGAGVSHRAVMGTVIENIATLNVAAVLKKRTSTQTQFVEKFDTPFVLEENWPISRSGSANWWVSSGAYLISEGGIGRTIMGKLDASDPWVAKFALANARDTDQGYRPQNIFRLVLKKKYLNATQEVYARIAYYEPSESEARNASNGILLFNRYIDENTLYYAGVRVDGQAVIKKKQNGVYTTLAVKSVFEGAYDRATRPNLIPENVWFGVRSVVSTDKQGRVKIALYTDMERTGIWTLATEAIDDGAFAGRTISTAGYAGIRTDFMDVEFDDYRITP